MKKRRSKAVFLDRDGTILNERGYLGDPKKMVFYPYVFEALRRLKGAGFKLLVVSNQSGVARGLFTMRDLKAVNRTFVNQLKKRGVGLDGVYYCTAHPSSKSRDRKPRPGMVLRAAKELNLDIRSSYVIGDQLNDVLLAKNCGATPILVMTGAGKKNREKALALGPKISANLNSASKWIAGEQSIALK